MVTVTGQLVPDKYPQGDLFICDVADAVLKDVMPQMEHPFYALSKKPDMTTRRYEHNGNWLEVRPSIGGLATIYDKDILIYCISQIMAKLNQGEPIKARVRVNSHELLMFTNRGTSGKDYKALADALDRLAGTTIATNIRHENSQIEDYSVFNLIDAATIRRQYGFEGRLMFCDIILSSWVLDAIRNHAVLTLHRDYFRLRKPLEKRVYELARKHCGQQSRWVCSLGLLFKKSGSRTTVRQFRQMFQKLADTDHLPDYRVEFDRDEDKAIFNNRHSMPKDRSPKSGATQQQSIHPDTFERVAALGIKQDKYVLEQEFRQWIEKQGITVRDMDALFVEFCRGRRVSPTT